MDFSNYFGTITDKEITFKVNNNFETVDTEKVTSVVYIREPNLLLSILLICSAMAVLVITLLFPELGKYEKLLHLVLFMVFFTLGIAYYFGPHKIKIRAKGLVFDPIKVDIIRLSQGKLFYEAVKLHIHLKHLNSDNFQ